MGDLGAGLSLGPLPERILDRSIRLPAGGAGSISLVHEIAGEYRKGVDLGVACRSGRAFPLDEGVMEATASDLPFATGDEIAPMINGPGGTPVSELCTLHGHAHGQLAARGITVRRNHVGEHCTSPDTAGASPTLVKLVDELGALVGAPAETPIRTS